MKNATYKLLVTLLLLVVLLGGATLLYRAWSSGDTLANLTEAPTEAIQTGDTGAKAAPDFTVVDADGSEHSLSDYLGTPVVVNFWATWCGPCQMEMPEFEAAYQEYGDRIRFMMVNLTDGYSDTQESAAGFIEDKGYTFPVFFDTSAQAARTYGVSSIPVTCFIDARGNLVSQRIGMINADTLAQAIRQILPE